MLAAILQAQHVNQTLGGVVVLPWEVDELPGDWLDAFDAVAVTLPRKVRNERKVQAATEAVKKRRR